MKGRKGGHIMPPFRVDSFPPLPPLFRLGAFFLVACLLRTIWQLLFLAVFFEDGVEGEP